MKKCGAGFQPAHTPAVGRLKTCPTLFPRRLMNPLQMNQQVMTRRHFFNRAGLGLGTAALAALLDRDGLSNSVDQSSVPAGLPHFAPKAKRVIYLFQSGGPS